jgi:hypothetical protein
MVSAKKSSSKVTKKDLEAKIAELEKKLAQVSLQNQQRLQNQQKNQNLQQNQFGNNGEILQLEIGMLRKQKHLVMQLLQTDTMLADTFYKLRYQHKVGLYKRQRFLDTPHHQTSTLQLGLD